MTAATSETPLRVLLAIGDRTVEQQFVHDFPALGLVVARRTLDAAGLVEAAAASDIDVALVAADLHRLTEATLIALRERAVPVVVLARDEADTGRFQHVAQTLPARSPVTSVVAALRAAAARGADAVGGPSEPPPVTSGEEAPATDPHGEVIAVASGKGAPGKTTVALALAAELGRRGATVALVDGDLRGGNVAAYLDLDPRRGIVGLAASSGPLQERLAEELQAGPHCTVLAGVERAELAATLPADYLGAVIATLRTRVDRVVVDLGLPAEPAALRTAHTVVIVTAADLVSIWNARTGLPALRRLAPNARMHLLVNRQEGREHYGPDEVARALGVPVLGVVREDRKAARRAIAGQTPLSDTGGKAAHDLRTAAAVLGDAGDESRSAAAVPDGRPGRLLVER
ncbi:MAG: hypothetical protein C4558_09015 [Dehalococcoidia bacterium]|nr:MAG: hypothetical protein C4558_09015 [Dehalococcoidia bacterium]